MVGNGGDCSYFRWFGRRVGIGDEDVLILGDVTCYIARETRFRVT